VFRAAVRRAMEHLRGIYPNWDSSPSIQAAQRADFTAPPITSQEVAETDFDDLWRRLLDG
jgi:hypothetical protein